MDRHYLELFAKYAQYFIPKRIEADITSKVESIAPISIQVYNSAPPLASSESEVIID